ncbi:hypothetical protein ACVIGA_000914 [Bradyrhizobium sp. USDA 3240]
MSKIIEARAVISATDKTGSVFDKIAAKFKGVESSAKAFEGIKAPNFSGDMFKELERLKLTERQLQNVRKEFAAFHDQLKSGPIRAAHYMRAVDDWKGKTVNHWREVRARTEEAEAARKKYFDGAKGAGRFGMHVAAHAVGIGSMVYGAGHAIRSTAEAAGERGRAVAKYEMMGLSDDQLSEGKEIASAISSKFPSISRTEALDYLRTNASRLGSWDRSKEVAEPYARALIANKMSGGDPHEMEQIVRALEGMGKANTSGQITEGLNAFAKAKAANPDYTGEQFRSDMAAASSSKYGLSKAYMENVFPILASHTTGFGNKLATGLSAMVGQRMTKQAKAQLEADGLIKDGKLIDQEGWIANNFEWTQKYVRPRLEQAGVKFSENMTEEDKGKVVAWLAKRFSARNAADLVATNLLDEPLVEKGRHRHSAGLERMDELQKKDPILAFEGIVNQLKDAAVAMAKLEPVLKTMNSVSDEIAKRTKAIEKGDYLSILPEDDQRIIRGAKKLVTGGDMMTADDLDRERINARILDADKMLNNGIGDEGKIRLKKFDLEQALNQHDQLAAMPPIYSDAELSRWQEDAAREQASKIPLPRARPKEADQPAAMPPVQPLDNAPQRVDVQGKVEGEAKLEVEIKPSSWFEALVRRAENAIKLTGSLNTNGPGSTGKSSPDAGAPATGFNGVP